MVTILRLSRTGILQLAKEEALWTRNLSPRYHFEGSIFPSFQEMQVGDLFLTQKLTSYGDGVSEKGDYPLLPILWSN